MGTVALLSLRPHAVGIFGLDCRGFSLESWINAYMRLVVDGMHTGSPRVEPIGGP